MHFDLIVTVFKSLRISTGLTLLLMLPLYLISEFTSQDSTPNKWVAPTLFWVVLGMPLVVRNNQYRLVGGITLTLGFGSPRVDFLFVFVFRPDCSSSIYFACTPLADHRADHA